MKQKLISLKTKSLKYDICSNSPAVSDNLKITRFLPFSYWANNYIKSLEMFISEIFTVSFQILE